MFVRQRWTAGAVVLAVCAASAPGFTIVRNGRAACRIVVASPAHPTERFAADELRRYIRTITDVDLDIRMEGTAGAGPVISIGATRRSKYKNIKVESRYEGDDAFVIEPFGADLVIKGATPRATLYGVYALLEGIGSRWLLPGDPVGLQPGDRHDRKRTVANIEWTALKIPESPDFPLRILWTRNPEKRLDLACKQRLNVIVVRIFVAPADGGHPWAPHILADIRKRGMEPMFTGPLLVDAPTTPVVCVSRAKVVEACLQVVDDLVKEHPKVQYWSLLHDRGFREWCACDACRKIGTTADRAYYLQNRIAERIRKRRGRKPTTYFMHPRDAVIAPNFRHVEALTGGRHVDYVWFAFPDRCPVHTVFDPDRCKRDGNAGAYADLLKYVKHFKGKVVVHGGYSDPRRSYRLHPLGGAIAEEVRHFHRLGVAGMSVHADPVGYGSAAMNHAVLSRLLWKRREPLERIRRDFLQSLYGPQWEMAAEAYDGSEKRGIAFDRSCTPAELQRSTVEFLTSAADDLKDKRGKTTFQTEQIERLRLMVEYARAVERRDVEAFVKIAPDMVQRNMLPRGEVMGAILHVLFGVTDETKRKRLLERMGAGTR